jgi:hypothetical protein
MRLLIEPGNGRAGTAAVGPITHDAYQKALDQLLRDLRVEKG